MNEIFTAVGLLLFIEGLLYTIFPGSMKKMLNSMRDLSEQRLRMGGLIFAIIGFIIIAYIKKFQ
ncbi:MAG: DUF2065 domain-containing protein [Proteobacteria bacterium]|uniref:DUF2065 domain-containing protein n=1 Tax=Candidatus Fonsibacter lacus TaxID=2576439 RepID=A0A964XRZ3_9PROT|nr:DUF2065 domain-containing protein [Candidatus Fonsibacter lacus]NBP59806.1 DUF2065 domain-containing protein [Pseudomonadota bacterium]NCU72242.1 DUF2065 domain-containing protein [Candidatus Fonsibacter lacus]